MATCWIRFVDVSAAKKGTRRTCGADYLADAINDTIIDGDDPVLEYQGEKLGDLDARVVGNATTQMPGRTTATSGICWFLGGASGRDGMRSIR
jgi:hypothetical protein